MPQRIDLLPVTDFTGGLNLRANAFQLRGSESPDMLNVDLDPRGGFAMRNVITGVNEYPITGIPESLLEFTTMNQATKQVLTNVSTALFYTTGDEFTSISLAGLTTARTTGGRHRGAIYNDVLYFGNGVDKTLTWDGTTITDRTDPGSGGTYAPDYAAPTSAGENDIPIGKCFASHFDSMWVANLTVGVGGTKFPNRIRWSHPGHPLAWRSQDFIDIDVGHDGDYITAIIPFNERLYIFKNNSIHVLSGYSPTTFSVSLLTDKVGAPSQEAVCASEDALYFWHSHTGAYSYRTRGGIQWLSERIYPAITEGIIRADIVDKVSVGWVKNRLWCNVPTGQSTTADATYVFDPYLNAPAGGWTRYDTALGPIIEWSPPLTSVRWIAALADASFVVDLEQAGDQDSYAAEYLLLAGAATEYATTPDNAALDIVGDLELRAEVSLNDWTPAAAQDVVAKWGAAGQRSYGLAVSTSGALALQWSVLGTIILTATSTATLSSAIPTLVDGMAICIRATIDVNNGGGGHDVTFYWSLDTDLDTATWTQLGAVTNAGAGTTSIFSSTAVLTVGGTNATGTLAGKVYEVQVLSGIAGTKVVNTDFGALVHVDTGTIANLAWTLAGTAVYGGIHFFDIESFYTTRWFDAENPAQLKRWKRPEFVFERAHSSVLSITSFKDYNPSVATRSFFVTPEAGDVTNSNLWGTNWGTMVWGSDADSDGVQIEKGQTLGRCRSVRLTIAGPATSVRWAMAAITFKYIPLRIRG